MTLLDLLLRAPFLSFALLSTGAVAWLIGGVLLVVGVMRGLGWTWRTATGCARHGRHGSTATQQEPPRPSAQEAAPPADPTPEPTAAPTAADPPTVTLAALGASAMGQQADRREREL